jgi:hypothetical protein
VDRDTYLGSTFDDALALYEELGFEIVHGRDFTGRSYGGETPYSEKFLTLWHPDGVLAVIESHGGGIVVNDTKIYYNIQFPHAETIRNVASGGHFLRSAYDNGEFVWIGSHDTRVGLRSFFDRLRSAGTFRQQWVERPFLWLLTYTDTDDPNYDYEAINEQVISELPEHVRNAITPEEHQ